MGIKSTIAAAVAALTLTACGGASDGSEAPSAETGEAMCDHFAGTYHPDMSEDEQVELTNDLTEQARDAKGKVARYLAQYDAVGYLKRSAGKPSWQMGADLFAATCFDAGWKN